MKTPHEVIQTFGRNVEAVEELMHFDRLVLDVVIGKIERLNERWKRHLVKDVPASKVPKPNASLTADSLLQSLQTIREHESLRTHYDTILNQCLVLLVSFFASAAHQLFQALVVRALSEDRNPSLLEEELKITVADLRESDEDWSHLVSRVLADAKGISFQDMKSMARAFEDYCGYRPPKDRKVNNIILGQACRHAIVHAGSRVDTRLLRQAQHAFPRDVKTSLESDEPLKFSPSEIGEIAESMALYLREVAREAV